ncbi:DUF4255 domain-containing protein [Schlesneria paludicola]|uniref:DUF4255 domain-containing protein n=1 Tax=Schlesneria paludicola TaxID=360056 RepID=UPI00029A7440|nr:DUF4255 domain-containing protein [Schlesneria paludicola]
MVEYHAIKSVTRVLKDILTEGVRGPKVETVPLDLINKDVNAGLNLYLYQVERNGRWNNMSVSPSTKPVEARAPLAVTLRYLLTAHGQNDLDAQDALERALSLFADHPQVLHDRIQKIAANSSLARQIEPVRLTMINVEARDLFHLWSTFQAPYRTSVLFQVEVILIEGGQPSGSPPPVAVRQLGTPAIGLDPPFPFIQDVEIVTEVNRTIAFRAEREFAVGEKLVLRGYHFDNVYFVRFTPWPMVQPDQEEVLVRVTTADRTNSDVTITLNPAPGNWRAGKYRVTTLTPQSSPEKAFEQQSNAVIIEIVPQLVSVRVNGNAPVFDPSQPPERAIKAIPNEHGEIAISISTNPPVRASQNVILMLNSQPIQPDSPPDGTDQIHFTMTNFDEGIYWLRLSVDGTESRLIDRSQIPLAFRAFRVEIKFA